MELVFVRHGQPAWSVDGISQPDPALTAQGREQARLLAARLAGEQGPIEVITSPLRRARETTHPIVPGSGEGMATADFLEEMRMPDWTGTPEEAVQQVFHAAYQRPPAEWWAGIPGGEAFDAFHTRVTDGLNMFLAERGVVPDVTPHLWRAATDEARRTVIVAHAGTNAVALGHLLGLDPTPWEWERFVLGHAAVAQVNLIPLAGGFVFSLGSLNDQEHIPPRLRSR